jgi:hypothetical protein
MTTADALIARRYARLTARAANDPAVAHSMRFRQVSNRYPHQVAMAYGGDLARAANDSDDLVAETVAGWELDHDPPVMDWPAIGAAERGGAEYPDPVTPAGHTQP